MNKRGAPQRFPCMQTDQVRCYDALGREIPCADTGQDGAVNAGAPWPDPRFKADGDTVRDRLTGLIWIRNAGMAEFPMTWREAFDYVLDMNARRRFGLGDWRMPDRRELFSLVSHVRVNPAVSAEGLFENVFSGYYWTATPCARYPRQAWYVHFGGGRVFKGMTHGSYMVWPVHDGAAGRAPLPPSVAPVNADERFDVHEKTAFDRFTGLTWPRNADILGRAVNWEAALDGVKRMNAERMFGHADWRLPNIRELESLTDMAVHSPAVAFPEVFHNIRSFYWSATTSAYDTAYAWTLYADDGNIGVGFKANPEFYAWPVRGGSGEP